MFEDFEYNTKKEEPKKYNNNYKSYNKKSKKYENIKGKYTIDIWGKDLRVQPIEYDPKEVKQSKLVTITFPSKTMELTEEEKTKIKNFLVKLKEKGYKLRVFCDQITPIKDILFEIFSLNEIYFITPWKSFCKANYTQYLPTDDNIKLAAHYVKNYQKLPGAVRAIMAGVVTTLVGLKNNEPVTYIVTYDKNYKNGEFDFKKSPDASNYYVLAKKLSFSIYNIAEH